MPSHTKSGRPRAARAAQFMPFAALTGYYRLVREQERVVEPRHDLTDEEAEALSRALASLERDELARVTFYERDGYVTRADRVRGVDAALRRLRLGEREVAFDDIRSIQRGGIEGGGA